MELRIATRSRQSFHSHFRATHGEVRTLDWVGFPRHRLSRGASDVHHPVVPTHLSLRVRTRLQQKVSRIAPCSICTSVIMGYTLPRWNGPVGVAYVA